MNDWVDLYTEVQYIYDWLFNSYDKRCVVLIIYAKLHSVVLGIIVLSFSGNSSIIYHVISYIYVLRSEITIHFLNIFRLKNFE